MDLIVLLSKKTPKDLLLVPTALPVMAIGPIALVVAAYFIVITSRLATAAASSAFALPFSSFF